MKLTKYTHSCVRIVCNDKTIVIDPGIYSETILALEQVDLILITHEHADHFDATAVKKSLEENQNLQVWGPGSVIDILGDFSGRAKLALPDMAFEVEGVPIRTFGGQHEMIHNSVPIIANIGYLVNEKIYHPGDSLTIPHFPLENFQIDTLLLPTQATWCSLADILDFFIAVRPKNAYQIHDSFMSIIGQNVIETHVKNIADRFGLEYRHLNPGDTIRIA